MSSTFEDLKDRWINLVKNGEKTEADRLYWEKMFPYIKEKFAKETEWMIKNGEIPHYDLIIMPIGFEPAYHIILINAIKPKQVYFLCTKEGEKYILDKVIKMSGLKQDQYKKDVIEYEGIDVSIVYEKIKKRIEMFKGKKIAIDLTRGSRIVAAGAAIVGDFFGCDLIHIEKGWIKELNIGEPGKERLVKVKNPLHIFGDLENLYAIKLFNEYQYIASNLLFRDIINKTPDPREFEIKSLISECYMFWDSFNYKGAFQIIQRVVQKIDQYDIKKFDYVQLKRNLNILKHLSEIQSSEKKFIDMLKNDDLVIHLTIDLFCNGERRAEQNKFEDAISRFYRAIELISQHRLSRRGIDSSSPDYNILGSKVKQKFDEINKEIYKEEKTLPLQTALKTGHIILFALEDDIWKEKTIQELKNFIDCIKLRDSSFVAHGIQIVSRNSYKKLKNIIKDFLERLCKIYSKDFDSLIEYHRFLKL